MQLSNLADLAEKSSVAAPDTGTASELAAKQANVNEYKKATAPKDSGTPGKTDSAPADRIAPKARYGARPGEKRIDTSTMTRTLGSFEKGTSHVPKTGIYKLHEGEAVIPKDKNMDSMKDKMMDSLGGDKKPKKEIKEMVHSKSHNGHHIVVHKHHHPEHHPDETHTLDDMAALHAHMDQHAGEPNEGEGPESAPQGGAAAPMTAAPSPMPPAGGQGAQ